MVNSENDRTGALLIDPAERHFALSDFRRIVSQATPISGVTYTDRANVYDEQSDSQSNLSKVNGFTYAVLRGVSRGEAVSWSSSVRPGWTVAVSGSRGDSRAVFHSAYGYDVECVWRVVP